MINEQSNLKSGSKQLESVGTQKLIKTEVVASVFLAKDLDLDFKYKLFRAIKNGEYLKINFLLEDKYSETS
jgi:hypothetical protein